MKNSLFLIVLFILTSCGFASGLYQDILSAQDHLDDQNYQEAVNIYEGILVKKPSKIVKIKIHYQLGEIYSIYLSNYKKSLEHFYEIVEYSNEPLWQVKSLEKIADIFYEDTKNYNEAERIFEKLMHFYPPLKNQSDYKFKYAMSIFYQRKYKNADKLFTEITSDSKSSYFKKSLYYQGLSNFYMRKWEAAISHWVKFISQEKRSDLVVQAKFMIANANENLGNLKDAYNYYYSILGEYPNSEVIKERLNSLYKRRVARKR